jgi:hypothetical protein
MTCGNGLEEMIIAKGDVIFYVGFIEAWRGKGNVVLTDVGSILMRDG